MLVCCFLCLLHQDSIWVPECWSFPGTCLRDFIGLSCLMVGLFVLPLELLFDAKRDGLFALWMCELQKLYHTLRRNAHYRSLAILVLFSWCSCCSSIGLAWDLRVKKASARRAVFRDKDTTFFHKFGGLSATNQTLCSHIASNLLLHLF